MSRPQTKRTLRSIGIAFVTAVGLGIAGAPGVAASPEEEIARLDRVRANLFEELVKTRAEAAAVRAELEAAIKARDAAEAELARLKQQAASTRPPNPAPIARAGGGPQKSATNSAPRANARRSVRPAGAAVTGSVSGTATAPAQRRVVRTGPAQRRAAGLADPAQRQSTAAPVARAQELPSALRLEDQR